ncbi:unnamed protein product [Owenia fusiformis]|uniref:Telomeric repeat-binding factor 2-interacting protein 1 n=1 Tax=Owenia fusiformis TaxID=6347 RepID=A0A8S4PCL4_OWEFU|nr:unnamed protein product [Owenia fusiformis]
MAEMSHSDYLFTREDGGSLCFHLGPSEERKRLAPLIRHGGGEISGKLRADSIKLILPGSTASDDGFVLSTYIDDCVEKNHLLPMEKYSVDKNEVARDNDDDLEPANYIVQAPSSKSKTGRRAYLLSEDINIIKFICEEHSHNEVRGNAIWKKMQKLEITKHPWQSMRDRYMKKILPNISSYRIKSQWMSLLTNMREGTKINDEDGTSSRKSGSKRTSDNDTDDGEVEISEFGTSGDETDSINDDNEFDRQHLKVAIPDEDQDPQENSPDIDHINGTSTSTGNACSIVSSKSKNDRTSPKKRTCDNEESAISDEDEFDQILIKQASNAANGKEFHTNTKQSPKKTNEAIDSPTKRKRGHSKQPTSVPDSIDSPSKRTRAQSKVEENQIDLIEFSTNDDISPMRTRSKNDKDKSGNKSIEKESQTSPEKSPKKTKSRSSKRTRSGDVSSSTRSNSKDKRSNSKDASFKRSSSGDGSSNKRNRSRDVSLVEPHQSSPEKSKQERGRAKRRRVIDDEKVTDPDESTSQDDNNRDNSQSLLDTPKGRERRKNAKGGLQEFINRTDELQSQVPDSQMPDSQLDDELSDADDVSEKEMQKSLRLISKLSKKFKLTKETVGRLLYNFSGRVSLLIDYLQGEEDFSGWISDDDAKVQRELHCVKSEPFVSWCHLSQERKKCCVLMIKLHVLPQGKVLPRDYLLSPKG